MPCLALEPRGTGWGCLLECLQIRIVLFTCPAWNQETRQPMQSCQKSTQACGGCACFQASAHGTAHVGIINDQGVFPS